MRDPLSPNPPHQPLRRRRPRFVLPRGRLCDCLGDLRALLALVPELDGVVRPGEVDDGPPLVLRLLLRGRARCARGWVRKDEVEGERQAYTTRWMLERRMPPLKMLSASPTLQTACPGRGYMRDLGICAVSAENMDILHLDIEPPVRAGREDLQPAQAIVKE